jgi:hypothetical protein
MLLGIRSPNIFVRGLSDIAGNSIPDAVPCAKRIYTFTAVSAHDVSTILDTFLEDETIQKPLM